MRTRRSPRNQQRLYRLLAGPQPAPVVDDEVTQLERSLAQPFLSARTRRMLERDLQRAKMRAAVKAKGEKP